MEKLQQIKAIFFDLDNTLIQTRKGDKLACNKLKEILENRYSIPSMEADSICTAYLKQFRQKPDNEIDSLDDWRLQIFQNVLGEKYYDLANEIYQTWLKLRFHYLSVTLEVKQMLEQLRENYLLALISNGPSRAQWEKVEKLKLRSYFDLILISGDLPWEKPNKKIFEKAYGYFGVDPGECMMIGDKLETDILGGIEAKLGVTVWLPLSGSNQNYIRFSCSPTFTINKVIDVKNLLGKKMGGFRRVRPLVAADFEDSNSSGSDGS